MVGKQHLPLLIHALSLGHEELHILVLTEEVANGIGNFLCAQHSRGKLIKERLEEMIVVAIHQEHIHILLGQILGQFDAAKTAAYYDNLLSLCHGKNLPDTIHTFTTMFSLQLSEKINFNM